MFCEKCGQQISEGAEFCSKCGDKVVLKEAKTISKKQLNEKTGSSGKQKSAPEKPKNTFSGRQIFSSIVIFAILGLLAGYFIYGHIEGEYIKVDEFFKDRNIVSGFVANNLMLIEERRNNIFLFGIIGLVLGVIYSVAMAVTKSKKGQIVISLFFIVGMAAGIFFTYQSVERSIKFNPVSGFKHGVNEFVDDSSEKIRNLFKSNASGGSQANLIRNTMADMKIIGAAIESYITDNGQMPDANSMEELASVLQPFYIKRCPMKDAWLKYFGYAHDADRYWLSSSSGDKRIVYSNGQFTNQ